MSSYIVRVWAAINMQGSQTSENIDLIDDFGYNEEKAQEVYSAIQQANDVDPDVESDLREAAVNAIGYEYGYSVEAE